MNKDVPPVERSISAYTLAKNLAAAIEACSRLQQVQQPGTPVTPPPWWDSQTTDLEWRARVSNRCSPNRDDRLCYFQWRCERMILLVLQNFDSLAAGAVVAEKDRRAVDDARTGLRAMATIISGAQMGSRWMYGVVPEASQVEVQLPEVYVPEPTSALEEELDSATGTVAYVAAIEGKIPSNSARRIIRKVDEKRLRVRRAREKRIRLHGGGKVTPERRAELERLVEDWREIIHRWSLAVRSVMHALDVLRGVAEEPVEEMAPVARAPAQAAPAEPAKEMAHAAEAPAETASAEEVPADVQYPGSESRPTLVGEVAAIAEVVIAYVVPLMEGMFKSKLAELLREARQRRRRSGVPKRKFTQATLTPEVRRIIAEAFAELATLRAALASGSADKVAAARQRASARFGARAIADRLGVKSHTIVRKNVLWLSEIGVPLGLVQERGPVLAMSQPRLPTEMVAEVIPDRRVQEPGAGMQIADYSAAERAFRRLEACPTADPAVVAAVRKILAERTHSTDDLIDLIETYLEDRDPRPMGAGRGNADRRKPLSFKELAR